MDEIRLQKFLAECGISSRRKSEELIKQGRVQVNGQMVTEMGMKVSAHDRVRVDGKEVCLPQKKVYILLHKPVKVVTTAKDQFGRVAVLDLVNDIKERIYPVGRLDYDTSGLLILTNDGEFTYLLTHPKHEIKKVYVAEIEGIPDNGKIRKFEKGLQIENYRTAPANFKVIESRQDHSLVQITIHEGKNRQVRKMCDAIGHPVKTLKRIAIGELRLGTLEEGKWRHLTKDEIHYLIENSRC